MKNLNSTHNTSGLSKEDINEISEANEKIVETNRLYSTMGDLIEIKKAKNNRANELRKLHLNVGMIISLLAVIIVMNWKFYDDGELVDLGEVQAEVSEIIDIPISEQPPPPPPAKIQNFIIEEVKDTEVIEELKITLDVEVTDDEAIEEIEYGEPDMVEEKVDEIFMVVEEEPTPVGGMQAFYAYLAEELKYPSLAIRLGVSGNVFVRFVVEKDGTITQAEVMKGNGAGCDEEAIRVLTNSPAWKPGKQRGQPVRVRRIIPIRFVIQKQ